MATKMVEVIKLEQGFSKVIVNYGFVQGPNGRVLELGYISKYELTAETCDSFEADHIFLVA